MLKYLSNVYGVLGFDYICTVIFCNKIEFVGAYRIDILSSTNLKKNLDWKSEIVRNAIL